LIISSVTHVNHGKEKTPIASELKPACK